MTPPTKPPCQHCGQPHVTNDALDDFWQCGTSGTIRSWECQVREQRPADEAERIITIRSMQYTGRAFEAIAEGPSDPDDATGDHSAQ